MARRSPRWGLALLFAVLAATGCSRQGQGRTSFSQANDLGHYRDAALHLEHPDIDDSGGAQAMSVSPLMISPDRPPQYQDLELEEAVRIALENSTVLRDLSGVVLRNPESVRTVHGPALVETDPRFGVDAALAAFDANLASRAFWEKNDRALNNIFFGGGTRTLQQDVGVYQTQITKRAAPGTELAVRHNTDYDANNAPGNQFGSAWNTNVEAEIRQPLLQGYGTEFNRIAGPSNTPGLYGGVVLARINTDISLADFELGVRDLVSNVENAYWDLYLSYRNLHASVEARNIALDHWRRTEAIRRQGVVGSAQAESEARRNYYRFVERVENAWNGRLLEGTETNNGSSGGTLRSVETIRGSGGVRVNERRLRLLLGLPITDGVLLRPADEPLTAKVVFNWDEMLPEALARRAELRRQRWEVKRQELELIASRNYLLPQLDAVGRYRWRGFGKDLIDPAEANVGQFDNAYRNLLSGDFQEWQLGVELSVPLGRRQGHAAVRHAELALSRERAVLREQERTVVHDLSDSLGEVARAYDVVQTKYNLRVAALDQWRNIQAAYDAGAERRLEAVVDAHYQSIEEDALFYVSLVDYTLAVRNVHFEKGSLLDYCEVYLAEGPWPGQAYRNSRARDRRRHALPHLNYIMHAPCPVSRGLVPQQIVPSGEVEVPPDPFADEPAEASRPSEVQELPPPPPADSRT
jgi:hypothetical protein